MQKNISVNEWKSLFKETGLDEAAMNKWHNLFESRHPDGHQNFLEWLGLPENEIGKIRAESR